MDNHWAITTSSGRRVSLLCDDDNDYPSSGASNSAPSPPLSPFISRTYRAFSLESSSSSSFSSSSSSAGSNSPHRAYSPPLYLPPLDHLLPGREPYFPSLSRSRSSISTSPSISPLSTSVEDNVVPAVSQPSPVSTISNPPSPKSSSTANPVIKRSLRRYTCHCGKSFTTSGHLARHTRIHTGEKNYICPEVNCGARFSRQDNCMQHFRTHQTGSGRQRAFRRRRMSTDGSINGREKEQDGVVDRPVTIHNHQRSVSYSHSHPYLQSQFSRSFTSEGGLAALASVAIASYQ